MFDKQANSLTWTICIQNWSAYLHPLGSYRRGPKF